MSTDTPKILIIGNGWIGNILKKYLNAEIFPNRVEYGTILPEFDVLINCAGKTNIDWAENHKLETVESNISLATYLAMVCKERKKRYVFISSACIFSSKSRKDVKDEASKPDPQCFYAETKVMAEKLIQEILPDTLIVRIRLPLSETPHPRNTITKLLSYSLINNQQESVTVVEDMLPILKSLILSKEWHGGICHLINKDTISPAQIARLAGHSFATVSKREQDQRLKKENRAQRVTTYVKSTYPMPSIKTRIKEIIKKYNEESNNR